MLDVWQGFECTAVFDALCTNAPLYISAFQYTAAIVENTEIFEIKENIVTKWDKNLVNPFEDCER